MKTGYKIPCSLIITFVLILQGQILLSLDLVLITKEYHKVYVSDMDQYIDSTSSLGFDDLIRNPELFYFSEKVLQGTRNIKFTYWLKFALKGSQLENENYYLICSDNRISEFEIWFDSENQTPGPVGTNFVFDNRSIRHSDYVFLLPKKSEINVIVKVRGNQSTFFSFEVKNEKQFFDQSIIKTAFLGGAYGFLTLSLFFSLFMLLRFKERIYSTFPLFALVALTVFLYIDGSGFHYIWSDHPEINLILLLTLPIALMFSLGILVISVLDGWKGDRKYVKIIFNGIGVGVTGYVFVFTIPEYFIHNAFYLAPFLCMLYCIVDKFRSGYKTILPFLFGFIFILLANGVYMLKPFFAAEYTVDILDLAPHLGVIALLLTLTYSQFKRFYYIQSSRDLERKKSIEQLQQLNEIKDRINEEIAIKVDQQTKELAEKNTIIHQQNAALQEFNDKLKEQTDEIVNLNLQLNEENKELKSDVQKINELRIFQNSIPFDDFRSFFNSSESCYSLLEELKWKDGFKCSKCGNEKYGIGKGEKARRCTKCGTNESVTSNTIFHRLHFPILKGFYILFLVNKHGDNLISKDLSEIVDLRLATCWKFSKKVKEKKQALIEAGKTIETWLDLI